MTNLDSDLLTVNNLQTYFYTSEGTVPAVDGVSLTIHEGETLGLVGESGSGKSVTALSIMRLIAPPGKSIAGEIIFAGTNLLTLPPSEMTRIRGDRIAMIFQEPMTSLNPVFTVGAQISESLMIHMDMDERQARKRTVELLGMVGIPNPAQRFKSFPHELSGGMRQRVMIAMAIACDPQLLIADEPTTALDVTIQAQILELLKALRTSVGLSVLLITHDLGVIAEMADRVIVMYAGKIVEQADVVTLFKHPKHPYTQGLLTSIPTLATARDQRLNVIQGTVPNMYHLPPGCKFAARCPFTFARCLEAEPPLLAIGREQWARCWLHDPTAVASRETESQSHVR